MTSKEIITALLARRPAERYGHYEHIWPETYKEFWPQQGYPVTEDPSVYFEYDIYPLGGWVDTSSFVGRDELVEETAEWKVTKNGKGATLKHWKNKSGTPEHIGFEVTTPEIWQKYKEPLTEFNPARYSVKEYKERLAIGREKKRYCVAGNCFVFELLRAMVGDEHFLPAMLLEPDWIKDICQTYLDFYIRHYAALFEGGGLPDGMWIYEDLGYKNGLFCSPALLDELIFPYHKKLLDFFHDYKLPVIIHSCGDIRKAVPGIINAGYACLQPMEAKAGVHVVELAKLYKDKLAFMGNIDITVLITNDRAKIKDEIESKMQALKKLGASYIFHSDHSIPPEVTLETYRYILDIFRKNAKL